MTRWNPFKPRTSWASAVYLREQLSFPLTGDPEFVIKTNRFLRSYKQPHTIADPFLFTHEDKIYVFFETQVADDFGQIQGAEVTETGLKDLGTVLSEPFHLSYPAIFQFSQHIYTLPNCADSGEMRLYRFEDFPQRPLFFRSLIAGEFMDPSPIVVDDTLYIFATTAEGLQLYFTDDPTSGSLELHPDSPITNDPRFDRCGGSPFTFDGVFLRPAQNCLDKYGSNIDLMRIEELTKDTYRESVFEQGIFRCQFPWNAEGGHHLSYVRNERWQAIAIDGQALDSHLNRLLTRLWMAGSRRKRR